MPIDHTSPFMSKILYFCLPISEEHINIRLRGIQLSDDTAYFVLYDFINILLGVEFETTNTRKIFLRLQNKLGDSCEMFTLQFCGSKSHEYPCMTLQNLNNFKKHCLSAKTNEIDVMIEMFLQETILHGFEAFLAQCFAQSSLLTNNFQSVCRANLQVCIDETAANEPKNFQSNATHFQINGLFCGGEYLFHLDECLLYLKAYAKNSCRGKSFCQKLRNPKYSSAKEYEKILKFAVKPLENVSMCQSSSAFISCENVMKLIEISEQTPNLNARCSHGRLLSLAIKQVMAGTIHLI